MMDASLRKHKFYVITGGPGTGKTTLLHELQQTGHFCVSEVARQVIKEQLVIGGEGLPWVNLPLYTALMLERSLETYHQALNHTRVTFFDRGIPDSIAYARIAGMPISRELDEAAWKYRYDDPVFMLPPWAEIYQQDEERKEDYRHSVVLYNMLVKVFEDYDYKLVEVPKVSLRERVEFISDHIK
jgi:predicted ATPase